LRGLGEGTFTCSREYAVSNYPRGLTVADFNQDGRTDVATPTSEVVAAGTVVSHITLLAGAGNGSFAEVGGFLAAYPEVLTAGLERDGRPDIVVDGGTISVFLATGDFAFGPSATYDLGPVGYSIELADLNGDGHLDIAALKPSYVRVLFGDGTGSFGGAMTLGSFFGGEGVRAFVVRDLDADGDLDFAVPMQKSSARDAPGSSLGIWLGNGDGTFGPPIIYGQAQGAPAAVAAGDFDADGRRISPKQFMRAIRN
jgi:hypothetical protein